MLGARFNACPNARLSYAQAKKATKVTEKRKNFLSEKKRLKQVRVIAVSLACVCTLWLFPAPTPPARPIGPRSARLLCPQLHPSRLFDAYQLLTLARGIEKEKQQSRKRGLHKIQQNSDEDEEAPAKSQEELEAAVRATPKFGEQAERPPIIRMNKPPKVSRFRGYGPRDARGSVLRMLGVGFRV